MGTGRARRNGAEPGPAGKGQDESIDPRAADEPEIIHASASMRRLIADLPVIGASDVPVLIQGESGTSKELVARAIHRASPRAGGPWVALNCAAVPDTLLEDELFGHERGAFTGAADRRAGRFEVAHGGTLFLDEIGELSPAAQAKLLRVLQDGTFDPLGLQRPIRVDVRVISATHQDLQRFVAEGRFRDDLYYRLKVLTVRLPPLRERPADLPPLIDRFLRRHAPDGRPPPLSDAARAALMAYPFPGNVRELEHAIAHAVVMARGGPIDRPHLPAEITGYGLKRLNADVAADTDPGTLDTALRRFERRYLVEALRHCAGHRSRTARLLGISRKTLWHKIRDHRIRPSEYGGGP